MTEEEARQEPLARFAEELRELRSKAREPSYRRLAEKTPYSHSTIGDVLQGKSCPQWEFVKAYVQVCAPMAGILKEDLDRVEMPRWRAAHREMLQALASQKVGRRRAAEAAAALAGPPCTLPSDRADFTGRGMELEVITTSVADVAQAAGVVAVNAIDGMPGIGKTALAVHVAWQLADRFPDGQHFLDLHGYTSGRNPIRPEDALATLLTGDGLHPRYLPSSCEDRSALWRTRMRRKRALLVLDNVLDRDQVAPLLPGGASLVLITSRRKLGDLPAASPVTSIGLPVLPAADARLMFIRGADPHLVPEDTDLGELVRLCGYLPLAISILARVYRQHPAWDSTDLIEETRTNLLTFTAEKDTVAAAFAISLRYMNSFRERFLMLLGEHPGATLDPCAAAALTGTAVAEATTHLDSLYQDNLLTEVAYRRYGMHDLIRHYVRDRASITMPDMDREQALDRLLDYYQDLASHAGTFLARHVRPAAAGNGNTRLPAASPPEAPVLSGQAQALGWARAERGNLLACLDHVTATGQHTRIVTLTAAIAELLGRDGPWTEAIDRHTAAVDASRHSHDRLGQANALTDLAYMRYLTGNYPEAAGLLEQARDLYEELGDRLGQANALKDLGNVRRLTGTPAEAAGLLEQARDLYEELGDRLGQASALICLGFVRHLTGNDPEAAGLLEQAHDLYEELGDQLGQANALNFLGLVRCGNPREAARPLEQAQILFQELGDRLGQANALNYLANVRSLTGPYPEAARLLEQAHHLFQELGDRLGQANALKDLGFVQQLTGNYPQAAQLLAQAHHLYEELGDQHGQANALNYLGIVRRQTGNYLEAAQLQIQAQSLYSKLNNRLGQANTLKDLGVLRRLTGDYPQAATLLAQARDLYEDIDAQAGTVEALNELGTLCRLRGDLQHAMTHHRRSLETSRAIGSTWDEAHALAGLARCDLAYGHTDRARVGLKGALEIFRWMEASDVEDVAAELDSG